MSGFWNTAAIATSFGAIFSLAMVIPLNPSALYTTPSSKTDLSRKGPAVADHPKKHRKSAFRTAAQATGKGAVVTELSDLPSESLPAAQRNNRADDKRGPERQGAEQSKSDDAKADDIELQAAADYQQAIALANQGVVAFQQANKAKQAGELPKSLDFTRQEQLAWQESLQRLRAIPASSKIHEQALAKRAQYQQLLATATGKLEQANSEFLTHIITAAGVSPADVHITLCSIDAVPTAASPSDAAACRHHQGDQPMASPASLIKLPIAIALLHKADTDSISLSSDLYIEQRNFTEDAEGTKINIRETYSLQQVMAHMIDQSNNVATNQLIDYVGRDDIAEILTSLGYDDTYAGHKLAGDVIMPADAGTVGNKSTTDDITAMMVDVYSLETSKYIKLVDALLNQADLELAHAALKDLSPAITWLGEKTGQNDRVLATTFAMKVANERYAMTIAINYSGDTEGLQEIVRGVASHLLEAGL
ncbi:MAG: serine hydrolase [Cyanobacteria bacterium P01_A01_bin.116]